MTFRELLRHWGCRYRDLIHLIIYWYHRQHILNKKKVSFCHSFWTTKELHSGGGGVVFLYYTFFLLSTSVAFFIVSYLLDGNGESRKIGWAASFVFYRRCFFFIFLFYSILLRKSGFFSSSLFYVLT